MTYLDYLEQSFNSTMVRLKVGIAMFPLAFINRFNSTMVRLKDKDLFKYQLFLTTFQFHNGSIKSPLLG